MQPQQIPNIKNEEIKQQFKPIQLLIDHQQDTNRHNNYFLSTNLSNHYDRNILEDQNTQIQNSQNNYYDEYKKIYEIAYKLYFQRQNQQEIQKKLLNKIQQIQHKIQHFQIKCDENNKNNHDLYNERKQYHLKRTINHRTRRTAEEIERKYQCEAQFCDRCYGSQGSLQQHIKLKHPSIYKKKQESQS